MGRRRKRLVDVVRDGSFRAREDERLLLARDPLPWPQLEEYRRAARTANPGTANPGEELRAVALKLERTLAAEDGVVHVLGDLQAELRELGRPGSFAQLERFLPRYFAHRAGPRAGQPFTLDRFQADFLREFWRRDRHGRRVYQVGLLGIPKGNGKTPLAAALGVYGLVTATDEPEVYVFAGARDQAAIGRDFAGASIEDGPLAAWLTVGATISCPATRGEFEVLSSDGDLAQGTNPTFAIGDELWLFLHRKQREAWNAARQALHKRGGTSALLGISTAGFTKESLLGEMYDAAVQHQRLEVLRDGYLLVLRDREAGFLFWWYGAPEEADIEDVRTVRRANPAPWIDAGDILKDLHRPGTDEYDWRRLNLNQWTRTRDAWFAPATWARLRSQTVTAPVWETGLERDTEIRRGAEVFVAVDAALKYDTTAVVWAHRLESGRIALRCRVWAARENVPHHVYVPGGRIDNELASDFIQYELAERYRVREAVADSRFFDVFLERLSAAGLVVAEFPQSGALMRDAEQHFYEAVGAGTVSHDGDPVFAKHVAATAAVPTRSGWKVFNPHKDQPIDATTGAIMARERAALDAVASRPQFFELV